MKRREPTSDGIKIEQHTTMKGIIYQPLPPRPNVPFDPRPVSPSFLCNSIPPTPSHARTHARNPGPCAMPPRLTFEYNPLSYAYPDDESDKELFLQAFGTIANHLRTVLLYWVNMVFNDGEEEEEEEEWQVWQVVRLDRREDDVHKYVYPDLIVVDGGGERELDETFSLGVFSRDQREGVLECAEEVEYDARSGEEGECLRWMCRLLERMIEEGLVGRAVVDAIREAVPLPSSRR